jgi:hypothetical protein
MAELLTTYSSLRLQTVDACVIALAERLDLHEISALDRRDFQVVAPRHLPRGSGSSCCRKTDPQAWQETVCPTVTCVVVVCRTASQCTRRYTHDLE